MCLAECDAANTSQEGLFERACPYLQTTKTASSGGRSCRLQKVVNVVSEDTLPKLCSNGGFVKLVYRPLRLLIWILFRSHPHALSFHQSTPAHVALTYPAMALTPLFILTGCFSWPLDLSGSTLQPSGPPPPPPPGSYLHPSDAPDGLLSAQTVHRITLLSQHSTGPWLRLKMFPEPVSSSQSIFSELSLPVSLPLPVCRSLNSLSSFHSLVLIHGVLMVC